MRCQNFLLCGDGFREFAKQPRHLGRGFEMAFAMRLQPEAGFLDAAAMADAAQHILQGAGLRCVVEHVIGGNEFYLGHLREILQRRADVPHHRARSARTAAK